MLYIHTGENLSPDLLGTIVSWTNLSTISKIKGTFPRNLIWSWVGKFVCKNQEKSIQFFDLVGRPKLHTVILISNIDNWSCITSIDGMCVALILKFTLCLLTSSKNVTVNEYYVMCNTKFTMCITCDKLGFWAKFPAPGRLKKIDQDFEGLRKSKFWFSR